ncbi:MAG: DUF362 domain-containing protein [Planctomycetes bacterium]|nr:DUF362 domain-containing protein [Planctomycetota bacterium]
MSGEHISRRECLTRGAGAALAAGAAVVGGIMLHDRRSDRAQPPSATGAVSLPDYFAHVDYPASNARLSVTLGNTQKVEELIRTAITGLDRTRGMGRFVTRGDVVLIKPNVGFGRPPHLGATTNPEVLRWVIRLCREAGAQRIVIADNPIEAAETCYTRSGIGPVAAAEGAEIALPRLSSFKSVMFGGRSNVPDARRRGGPSEWPVLYEPLRQATKVIGIAPVKDHNLAGASIVLKNWYGLLGGRRNQLHQAIDETISDLAALLNPTLVIADGTRVMLRNGPTGGRLSDVQPGGKLGRPTVVAAVDQVACDAWCYEQLLGRDPKHLAYLARARSKSQTAHSGRPRFCESDWRVYERQGLLRVERLG